MAKYTAVVSRVKGQLFASIQFEGYHGELLIPLAEVCNPDTLGAANNPEEFVMPSEGEDIKYYYDNYLRQTTGYGFGV